MPGPRLVWSCPRLDGLPFPRRELADVAVVDLGSSDIGELYGGYAERSSTTLPDDGGTVFVRLSAEPVSAGDGVHLSSPVTPAPLAEAAWAAMPPREDIAEVKGHVIRGPPDRAADAVPSVKGVGSAGSVLVAMSGGVDSSVAAGLLKEAGHVAVGVHLKLVHGLPTAAGCCGPQAEADARAVARAAGLPLEVLDLTDVFEEAIIAESIAELERGRTPNPCVLCNERIRFGALLEMADVLGMDFVGTGHYARAARGSDGQWRLYRGRDPSKDQSYVLYRLGQGQLARSLFPLGGMTKAEVRTEARRLGLPVADKRDSQDLCFLPGGDWDSFARAYAPHLVREGEIVDTSGRVLGRHRGTFRYTVGQRRSLGLSTGERKCVAEIDARTNRVIVGAGQLLARPGLVAERVNWVRARPKSAFEAEVQIRYRGEAYPALVVPTGPDAAMVTFRAPQRGVAPGQSAVFYVGDEVVGGGIIRSASLSVPLGAP